MKRYEEYKKTSVEFLDEIPKNWEEKRMRFIGYLYGGLSGKSANDFNKVGDENNKHFIPFTNIANNLVIDPNNLQTVVINENEKQNKVKKNDLFFLMSSENYDDVGKSAVLNDEIPETYLNSFCKGFRITKENIVSKFLNYQLHSKQHRHNLLTGANGFTRINLKIDKVKDLFTAIPPSIEEQTIIVNYLDKKTAEIDQLITEKKQLIELYQEEKTALINQAVTKGINPDVTLKESSIEWLGDIPEHWEVKKLRYLCKITTGDKDTENREDDAEYLFFVRSQTIEKISTFSFDGEAILTAGDGVGVCKVWHYINGKFDFHQRVYMMYEFVEISGELLFQFLKQNFIHEVLKKSAKSTVDSLRRPMFLDFPVAYSKDETEQTEIVQHIENESAKIDAKIAKAEQYINLLTEYRTALISEVVTGKIKVID